MYEVSGLNLIPVLVWFSGNTLLSIDIALYAGPG